MSTPPGASARADSSLRMARPQEAERQSWMSSFSGARANRHRTVKASNRRGLPDEGLGRMDGHIPLAKLKARNWNAFPAGKWIILLRFFPTAGKNGLSGRLGHPSRQTQGQPIRCDLGELAHLAGNIRVCVIWAKSGRLARSERAGGDVDWRQLMAALDAARLESPDLAALGDGRRIVDALLQHGLIRAD